MRPLRLVDAGPHEGVRWAEGQVVSLPDTVAAELAHRGALRAGEQLALGGELPPIDPALVDGLRFERAFTESPPVSARLPFSYQRVPPRLRSAAARVLGAYHRRRTRSWASFPGWPLDLSADFLADLASRKTRPRRPCPVVLTHDLDSAEGLANVVRDFLSVEEAAGARSLSFLVPCGWPIDQALVQEIVARGHHLGIHGYDHSGRTPFASPDLLQRRVQAARPLIERYGMSGYRAPSLLRTRALLRELAGLYAFDSSIPTSGGLFPVPNNGCASARPFSLDGRLVELPLSMPRDGSLLFLGYAPAEILRLWWECATSIARSGGTVVLLTHGEERFSGSAAMRAAYRELLERIAASADFAWWDPRRVPELGAEAA